MHAPDPTTAQLHARLFARLLESTGEFNKRWEYQRHHTARELHDFMERGVLPNFCRRPARVLV